MNKITKICIFMLAIYNANSCAMDDELPIKLSDYLVVGKVPRDDGDDDCLLWRYELAGCSDNADTQKKGDLLHLCRIVGAKKIIELFKGVVKSKPQLDINQLMEQAQKARVKHSEGGDYYGRLDEIKEFENCTPEYAVVEQSTDREEHKIIINKDDPDLQESLRMILSYPSEELDKSIVDQGIITREKISVFNSYTGCGSVHNQDLSCKLAGYLAHQNKRIGTFVVGTGADGELLHRAIRDALQVNQRGYITRDNSSVANVHKTCWIVDEE